MVPTLQVGQRVLVNRIGNRFADPKVGEIIVFHPPKGSDTDTCGDGNRRQGQACDKPTSTRADVNFIKRVVGRPGRHDLHQGWPRLSQRQARERWLHQRHLRERRRPRLQLPNADHHPCRSLVHDGRQPWRVRRQPLLGPGPAQMDHRRRLRDLLAAQAHRPPLALAPRPRRAPPRRGRPARSAGAAVTVMPVVTEPAAEPVVASAAMPAPDTQVAPAAPAAGTAGAARRRRARTKRRTGRRLFQFDRGLGVRWIAGADEAGRGCLAGPLVAAAVLFDVERLGVREVRGAHRAQRLQAARPRGARRALPGRHAHGRQGRRRLALRARHRRVRPAQDEPRRAARCARRRRAPGMPVPGRRLRGPRVRPRAAPDRRRGLHERGDRGRLDRRQGHARPLHAPRGRAASRAGSSAPTSATPRPSTARRSSARASRRCTGSRSRARRTSSWRSRRPAAIRTPPRGGRGARAGRARR